MNSEGDYTICNLDSHSYGSNGYTNSEIPATIYGYNNINNRSIDTGQHYYGVENMLPPGMSGVDLSLGTNQNIPYQVNSQAVQRGARHPGYDMPDGHSQTVDPYSLQGHHGLALNGDHLGGGLRLSPGQTPYGGACVDNMGSCSLANMYGTTVAQQVQSPIKTEPSNGQSVQNKPFRWMQIKRNPAKAGN